jgi:hypothetical protein
LAIVDATRKAAEAMANFADKINNIKVTPKEDEAPVGLANLYKKSAGQGLTQQDFNNFGIDYNNISKEDLTAQATEIFNSSPELKELYGEDGITEFVNFFVEQFTLGAEAMNRATEKLGETWWGNKETKDLFGKQAELDAGSMKNVINQLYDVFLTSGKDASDEMGAKLKDAFNKITDPEQAQKFADALGTIDWKNIDSVEQLNEILVETGFDATAAGIDIETLENDIKELAKASKKVGLDSLKQQIKSLDELAKNLTEREDTDRVFSDEERKALIQANRDMTDDFIMTGIDEWTYVGDSMGTLEGAVREATRALWETYSK